MDICLCEAIVARRLDAAHRLAKDENLPQRTPRGDFAYLNRLRYVLAHYPEILADDNCPLHGNLQRYYSKLTD